MATTSIVGLASEPQSVRPARSPIEIIRAIPDPIYQIVSRSNGSRKRGINGRRLVKSSRATPWWDGGTGRWTDTRRRRPWAKWPNKIWGAVNGPNRLADDSTTSPWQQWCHFQGDVPSPLPMSRGSVGVLRWARGEDGHFAYKWSRADLVRNNRHAVFSW